MKLRLPPPASAHSAGFFCTLQLHWDGGWISYVVTEARDETSCITAGKRQGMPGERQRMLLVGSLSEKQRSKFCGIGFLASAGWLVKRGACLEGL